MKKFEYEDSQYMDTGAGNESVSQIYVTNDIYDPDQSHTLVDHTVQNFGTFINFGMYRKWRVFGCKIKATFINLGGSQALVVPLLTNLAALPASSGLFYDSVNALSATSQAAAPVFVGPLTGGNNIVRRNYYCAPWVALGVTRPQYNADVTTGGTYQSRAGTRSFCSFVVIGIGSQATIEIRVSITYYCQMFDLAMGVDTLTPAAE